MISLPVKNPEGQQIATIDIDPADFGGEVNRQLLHDVVVMHQANCRVGTHNTKRRGEVAGSGKKLFRQKGTGNARVGTKRTNKRRGGGSAFGPKPRDYSYTMPKKARRLAIRMALLSKFQDDQAIIVDGLALNAPKTKDIVKILRALGVGEDSCLIATDGIDKNVYLSGRNIDGVEVLPAHELHVYALLKNKKLVLTKSAVEAIRQKAKDAAAQREGA